MEHSDRPPIPPILQPYAKRIMRAFDYLDTLRDWIQSEQDRRVVANEIMAEESKQGPHVWYAIQDFKDWEQKKMKAKNLGSAWFSMNKEEN